MIQMHADTCEAVGAKGTMRTSGLAVGMEHEVINDELTASFEEFGQRLGAVGAVEDVVLGDALPGQTPLELAHLVALTCKRFLLFEQFAPGGEPLLMRHHWMSGGQILVCRHIRHSS